MLQSMKKALILIGVILLSMTFSVSLAETPSSGQKAEDTYIIGPEDIMEIHVWKEDKLTREVLVRSDGMISMPLIDDVKAAGLSPMQLKQMIGEKLKEYVSEPSVSVIVKNPMNYKVYVTGQVKGPGVQVHRKRATIIQALALAGGLTETADEIRILLIREQGRTEKRFTIDYSQIVSGKKAEMNIPLEPGDTIVVSEKDPYQVFVVGNVQRPGIYIMKKEITFLQAISLSGGLNEWASKKVILISKEEGQQEKRRVINYKDVVSGDALDQNVVLKSGDTIVVP